jgi:hypothetical protein
MVTLEQAIQREKTLERMQAMPIEIYIQKFTNEYKIDARFRKKVHDSMSLTKKQKFGLAFSKTFRHSRYEKDTKDMITSYAERVRNQARELYRVMQEQKQSKQTENQLTTIKQEVEAKKEETEKAQRAFDEISEKQRVETERIKAEFEARKAEAEKKKAEAEEALRIKTDAERIAKEKIKEHLMKNQSLKYDGETVNFNEPVLLRKLEDLFLKEIVADIEGQTGKTGFLARVKKNYDMIMSYYGEMDDWSEISDVDIVESAITARAAGYRFPCRMEHFIVGKYRPKVKLVNGRVSVDTATVIDYSGSMGEEGKYLVAQKVAGATCALMRKLSANNNNYIAVYNISLRELTFGDLMKTNNPKAGTKTELALEFILDKLKDKGPSIANLITDGLPNEIEPSVEAAKKFQRYPQIQLRIFLIGEDENAKQIIRQIGRAAGSSTRVIPVTRYNLATGVISDFENTFRKMYTMEEF